MRYVRGELEKIQEFFRKILFRGEADRRGRFRKRTDAALGAAAGPHTALKGGHGRGFRQNAKIALLLIPVAHFAHECLRLNLNMRQWSRGLFSPCFDIPIWPGR